MSIVYNYITVSNRAIAWEAICLKLLLRWYNMQWYLSQYNDASSYFKKNAKTILRFIKFGFLKYGLIDNIKLSNIFSIMVYTPILLKMSVKWAIRFFYPKFVSFLRLINYTEMVYYYIHYSYKISFYEIRYMDNFIRRYCNRLYLK